MAGGSTMKAGFQSVLFSTQLIVLARASGQPFEIPWNTDGGHGPDGPWNYLKLNVGSEPSSSVDFYPMFGEIDNMLVRSDVCSSATPCMQPTPGYYSASSKSAITSDQNLSMSRQGLIDYYGGQHITGSGYFWTDTMSSGGLRSDDTSMFVLPNIAQSHGKKSWAPLSLLSLEPNMDSMQGLEQLPVGPAGTKQFTLIQQYTAQNQGSATMSLHMGVAPVNQSGSLVLGGYDQSRIIEQPAMFTRLGKVSLTNITIGTASGTSPWAHTTGVPSSFLPSGLPIDVLISPHISTMQLPQQTCDLLAQYLLLRPDPDTGLYLWNTESPSYHDIISSPSYLSFTFSGESSAEIKIPFAALNLNLTAPIKDKPTPYFPCEYNPDGVPGLFNLGRAFMQSAVLVQAWGDSPRVYIGQAAGPKNAQGQNSSPVPLSATNVVVSPAANAPKWEDTWSDILKPLSTASTLTPGIVTSVPTASTVPGVVGLSGGAVAGIVIGLLIAIALIAAAAFYFLRQRKRRAAAYHNIDGASGAGASGNMAFEIDSKARPMAPVEMHAPPMYHEAQVFGPGTTHEMSDTSRPVELAPYRFSYAGRRGR